MLPILSQVCSLNSPLEADLRDYAAGHCPGVELWLTKVESYVERHGVDAVRDLLRETGLQSPVASYQGGLLDSQGERRGEAYGLLERRLALCESLGVAVLVVACDTSQPVTPEMLQRVQVSLSDLARRGEQTGVRIALEFQARATVGNNLQTAVALVDQVGSPWLGICLDVFHFYVGPSKTEDLGLLTAENLLHVQLCDLADVPREWATDSDRILPGEGDLPLGAVLDCLQGLAYRGPVSIETMNPQIWQVPALQFGEIGITALRKVLGLNTPG